MQNINPSAIDEQQPVLIQPQSNVSYHALAQVRHNIFEDQIPFGLERINDDRGKAGTVRQTRAESGKLFTIIRKRRSLKCHVFTWRWQRLCFCPWYRLSGVVENRF